MMWLLLFIIIKTVGATSAPTWDVKELYAADWNPCFTGVKHILTFARGDQSMIADTASGKYAHGWYWQTFYPKRLWINWYEPPSCETLDGAEVQYLVKWHGGPQDGGIYLRENYLYCHKGDGSDDVVVPVNSKDYKGDLKVETYARTGEKIACISKGSLRLMVEGCPEQKCLWGCMSMTLSQNDSDPLFSVIIRGVEAPMRPASQYLKHFRFPARVMNMPRKGEPKISYNGTISYYEMQCADGDHTANLSMSRNEVFNNISKLECKVGSATLTMHGLTSEVMIDWCVGKRLRYACVLDWAPKIPTAKATTPQSDMKILALPDFSPSGARTVWNERWQCPMISNRVGQEVLILLQKDFVSLIYGEEGVPKSMIGFLPFSGKGDIRHSLQSAGIPLNIFKKLAEQYCLVPLQK